MYENMELPGMCNWCVENDIGWFVAYSINVLFQYDMRTKMLSGVIGYSYIESRGFSKSTVYKI